MKFFMPVFVLVCWTANVAAFEVCPRKFPVLRAATKGYIPFCSSQPIHLQNDRIERIVVALHSSNFDAGFAFSSVLEALSKAPEGVAESTLVVAPQFLEQGQGARGDNSKLIFWAVNPFWGSSRALIDLGRQELRLSAYQVLDTLLDYLTNAGRFPALRSIVVIGHSAGGQMVNRFAASSRFEPSAGGSVEVRFVVMNASSYVYFDGNRPVPGKPGSFVPPSPKAIASCPGYSHYGYGLEKLYSFHRKAGISAASMRRRYRQRRVVYLVGSEDRHRGSGLSTQCAAELQGGNRLERGRAYYQHLIDHFGPSIRERQTFEVVPGVGHSGRRMVASAVGQ